MTGSAIEGSCLCGTVRWKATGPFDHLSLCHCSMCRKAHGAPFGACLNAQASRFEWLAGEETLRDYESSPGFTRHFCPKCGSVAPDFGANGRVHLPAGNIDGDPGVRPSMHIFAASAAPWYTFGGNLPRHDAYPEGYPYPVIDRPAVPPAADGHLHGSCLCGAVEYEVTGPILRAFQCHCSRCRKARSSPHGANAFTAFDDVTFTRGEEALTNYKVPEAKFFTQAFCSICGSPMPRKDPDRGIAVIPMGSLDDDPHYPVGGHIFVASKASWFDIDDDLPRFDEMPD